MEGHEANFFSAAWGGGHEIETEIGMFINRFSFVTKFFDQATWIENILWWYHEQLELQPESTWYMHLYDGNEDFYFQLCSDDEHEDQYSLHVY